jgi:hypothetical protein
MVLEKISNIYYSIYRKVRDRKNLFNGIKRWFSYFKTLLGIYDFDWSSILFVERKQISRVRDRLMIYHLHEGYEFDVARMNLAIKLITIILEENPNCKIIAGNSYTDEKGFYKPNYTWGIDKYVNTRNVNRFLSPHHASKVDDPKIGAIIKDDLYVEKAWHLYYKLREMYTRRWWD